MDRRSLANVPIEKWLRQIRRILFYVAVPAETIHVDNNIPLPSLSKLHSETNHPMYRFRVPSVHMKNRDLRRPTRIASIFPGAARS
jgi:hypothetical protein